MNYTLIMLGWFLLGLVAKGIIRGNNLKSFQRIVMSDREDRLSVYWMLRWERDALLLGPIGLLSVVCLGLRKGRSFAFWRFSLKPHGLGVRLAFWPTYYNGRLIRTKTKARPPVLRTA